MLTSSETREWMLKRFQLFGEWNQSMTTRNQSEGWSGFQEWRLSNGSDKIRILIENHIHAAGLNPKPNQAERTNIFRSGRRRDATDSRGRNVMREVRDFFFFKKNMLYYYSVHILSYQDNISIRWVWFINVINFLIFLYYNFFYEDSWCTLT